MGTGGCGARLQCSLWTRVVTPIARDAPKIVPPLPTRPGSGPGFPNCVLPQLRHGTFVQDQRMRRALASITVSLLVLAAAGPAYGAEYWRWPVDPPRSVLRPFIAPETPYAPGHRGIDIRAPAGTVFAPASGVVHFAGTVVDRPVLSINHGDGVLSSYEPVTSTLTAGDAVSRGDPIGIVQSGHCVSLCLHFGVRVDGQYVSPLAWLGGIPNSVLLPTRRSGVQSP